MPKVEPTRRYFAELRASLKNGLDVTNDIEHGIEVLCLSQDEGWRLSRLLLAERLERAVRHVIDDSPGTPESVKDFLRKALRGY